MLMATRRIKQEINEFFQEVRSKSGAVPDGIHKLHGAIVSADAITIGTGIFTLIGIWMLRSLFTESCMIDDKFKRAK